MPAQSRWLPKPRRVAALLAGLWLFGTGEAMIVAAHLGCSPWTVLAQGAATRTHLPVGVATNLIGAVVLLAWIPLRQRPGVGTVANVLVVGTALDVATTMLPHPASLSTQVVQCVAGILVVALGSGLYLTCGLGPGPRDGLMTGLARVRQWPLGLVRTAIETVILALGWALGGMAGLGTLLFVVLIGPCVHAAVRAIGAIPDDQL